MRNHAFLQNSKHTACLRLITVMVCVSLLLSSAGLASASPLMTGEGGNTVYLPIAYVPPGPWKTVMSETFEGSFPGAWTLNSSYYYSGTYYDVTNLVSWGKRTCRAASGAYGGWVAGGGSTGSTAPCNGSYPDNYETWMIYGPIDLSQVQDGMMTLNFWADIEYDYDYLGYGVSTDHLNYYGRTYTGNSNGWASNTIDLKNVYTLGNVTGKSQVWVGLWFTSDEADVTFEEGAAVDNIVIATCRYVGGCVGSPQLSKATLIPESLKVQNAAMSLPQSVKETSPAFAHWPAATSH